MYKGIQSEVISTTRFDENSDLSTTYLGRIGITRTSKVKAEQRFPISERVYKVGKLLDSTECQILLDTRSSKSFTSKSHYLWCKSLHLLPEFASKMQRIEVGNGQFVSVLFVIPTVIYTWSQIQNLYISIQNTWICRLSFWHKEYIWIKRYYKFSWIMLYLSE